MHGQRFQGLPIAFWERAAALLLLIFAIYTIAAARGMTLMQGRVPGPGLAPFWIGVGLALASVAILVGSRSNRQQPSTDAGSDGTHTSMAVVIAAVTVVAVALIAPLGMLAALGLLLLVLARILGATWRTAAQTAVALPLALHVVFGVWLKVPMPRGPWGF